MTVFVQQMPSALEVQLDTNYLLSFFIKYSKAEQRQNIYFTGTKNKSRS